MHSVFQWSQSGSNRPQAYFCIESTHFVVLELNIYCLNISHKRQVVTISTSITRFITKLCFSLFPFDLLMLTYLLLPNVCRTFQEEYFFLEKRVTSVTVFTTKEGSRFVSGDSSLVASKINSIPLYFYEIDFPPIFKRSI